MLFTPCSIIMFTTSKAELVNQLGDQPAHNHPGHSDKRADLLPADSVKRGWRRSFKHFAESIALPGIADLNALAFSHVPARRLRVAARSSEDESSSGGDGHCSSSYEKGKRQRGYKSSMKRYIFLNRIDDIIVTER